MLIVLVINKHDKFGYYVIYDINERSPYPWYKNDIMWIISLKIDKGYYINSLLKLGAYNYCSYEFPSMFFKLEKDALNSIQEFYEPAMVMAELIKYI